MARPNSKRMPSVPNVSASIRTCYRRSEGGKSSRHTSTVTQQCRVRWYSEKREPNVAEPETVPDEASAYRLSPETVGEYIRRTECGGSRWLLTELGAFLWNVASFRDGRILTLRQEETYALCRISGVDSETLLKDHLSTAQNKITCAFNLVEAVNNN